jgi:hypothetical protein
MKNSRHRIERIFGDVFTVNCARDATYGYDDVQKIMNAIKENLAGRMIGRMATLTGFAAEDGHWSFDNAGRSNYDTHSCLAFDYEELPTTVKKSEITEVMELVKDSKNLSLQPVLDLLMRIKLFGMENNNG